MYKKIISFQIVLLFFCCISTKDVKSKPSVNYKSIENIGKIEVFNEEEVYFVINWESRSRITLKVIGSLKNEIKKLENKILEVDGKIIYESQWNGTIEIVTYKIIK